MSFPNISLLWSILKTIIWYGAQCVILNQGCSTFEVAKGSLNSWFTALKYYIKDKAQSLIDTALDYVWTWITWLKDRADAAYDKAVVAIEWINTSGGQVHGWYNWLKERLTQLATTRYNQLVALARDWYNLLVVLARDWYSRLVVLARDWYSRLVALARDWYNLLVALARDWYYNLVVLARDLFAWLNNFVYNAGAVIRSYLGAAWTWLVQLWATPLELIAAILGHPWRFLLSLFGLSPEALLAFIRDTLSFWYNMWSMYREILLALVSDPAGTILVAIRELFLDWLEDLIAENW